MITTLVQLACMLSKGTADSSQIETQLTADQTRVVQEVIDSGMCEEFETLVQKVQLTDPKNKRPMSCRSCDPNPPASTDSTSKTQSTPSKTDKPSTKKIDQGQ